MWLGLVIVVTLGALVVDRQVHADESISSDADRESPESESAEKEAPAKAPAKEPEKVQIFVAVDVPVNANAHDQFFLMPFPVKPPDATDDDFYLTSDRSDLKELLKGAILYKAGTPGQNPPDWKVDRALQLALRKTRKHIPLVSQGLDQWLTDFFPQFEQEVRLLNENQKLRKERYITCGLHEIGRKAYQEDAANKGLTPITVRVAQYRRGIRQGKTYVKPSVWWVVGTHTTPGLTYYWQEKRTFVAGLPRLVELTEANAALIKGHF